jgi:Tol biopolymer transport system component
MARPDGTRRVHLTAGTTDWSPSWSPNGKLVAFVRSAGPLSGLVIADSRGRIVRRIAAAGATDPAWSPDGKRIAFTFGAVTTQAKVTGTRIAIVSSSGGAPKVLATGTGDASSPAWSPNGRQIAYTDRLDLDQRRGVVRIQIVNPEGTERRLLVSPAGEPSWSPDGSKIAYVAYLSQLAETGHIAVVNANGSGARRLTSGSEAESGPAWSPRGRLIAFARGAGKASAVLVMRPDGSGERTVIRSRSYGAFDPAWRRPVALPKARRPAC